MMGSIFLKHHFKTVQFTKSIARSPFSPLIPFHLSSDMLVKLRRCFPCFLCISELCFAGATRPPLFQANGGTFNLCKPGSLNGKKFLWWKFIVDANSEALMFTWYHQDSSSEDIDDGAHQAGYLAQQSLICRCLCCPSQSLILSHVSYKIAIAPSIWYPPFLQLCHPHQLNFHRLCYHCVVSMISPKMAALKLSSVP